ncbi:MAG: hypothetical protein AB7O62_23525 [Pirellulales bacterium]
MSTQSNPAKPLILVGAYGCGSNCATVNDATAVRGPVIMVSTNASVVR